MQRVSMAKRWLNVALKDQHAAKAIFTCADTLVGVLGMSINQYRGRDQPTIHSRTLVNWKPEQTIPQLVCHTNEAFAHRSSLEWFLLPALLPLSPSLCFPHSLLLLKISSCFSGLERCSLVDSPLIVFLFIEFQLSGFVCTIRVRRIAVHPWMHSQRGSHLHGLPMRIS